MKDWVDSKHLLFFLGKAALSENILKPIPHILYIFRRLYWRITKPLTMGVRLILIKDQSILLVKHSYQQHWYLPGGGVEKGETLEQAVRRESKEEIGVKLGELQLFGVYTNFYEYKNDHIIVFLCRDFTLPDATGSEIESFNYFALDELPVSVSPGSKRRIDEYINYNNSPVVGIW